MVHGEGGCNAPVVVMVLCICGGHGAVYLWWSRCMVRGMHYLSWSWCSIPVVDMVHGEGGYSTCGGHGTVPVLVRVDGLRGGSIPVVVTVHGEGRWGGGLLQVV